MHAIVEAGERSADEGSGEVAVYNTNAGTPLGLTPRGASGLAQLSGEPGSSVPRPCLTNRALP